MKPKSPIAGINTANLRIPNPGEIDAAALAQMLRTPLSPGSMIVVLIATCLLSFHTLGSLFCILGFSAFGGGWILVQLIIGLVALLMVYRSQGEILWLNGARRSDLESQTFDPQMYLKIAAGAGAFICIVWGFAFSGGGHPGGGTRFWEFLGLIYVGALIYFAISRSTYQITASSAIVTYLPQTSGRLNIWFPRTGNQDTLVLLEGSGEDYRYATRGEGGYRHNLNKGSLFVINPSLALQSNSAPVVVNTTLLDVKAFLNCSVAIPRNKGLTKSGVHAITETLLGVGTTVKLEAIIKLAVEEVAGDIGANAQTLISDFNEAKLGNIIKRISDDISASRAVPVSAVGALSAALRDARYTLELIKKQADTWRAIASIDNNQWSKFTEKVRGAFREELLRRLVSSEDLSEPDRDTVNSIIDACGFFLEITATWSPLAREIKKFSEEAPAEWANRVSKIETEERDKLKAIIDGWLQDPSKLLAWGLPLAEIMSGLVKCRMQETIDGMSGELDRLLGPARTTVAVRPSVGEVNEETT